MKYTVKMSCGHEEQVELFGPGKDREKKIRYYQEYGMCKECYRVREEENLNGFLDIDSFPALKGTVKQIKWAEDIRKKAVIEINAGIQVLEQPEDRAAYEEVGRQYQKVFETITDAARIIEIREKLSKESIKYWVRKTRNKNG